MVTSMGILGKFHDPKIELLYWGPISLGLKQMVGTSNLLAPEMASENIT